MKDSIFPSNKRRMLPKLGTHVSLSAPDEIEIQLVRADYFATSNWFRGIFEVFLTWSSGFTIFCLSSSQLTRLHWVILIASCLSTVLFLGLSLSFYRRAKSGK